MNNLNKLPNPIDLQILCKSISVLEAIICQEWEYRYYSYQKDWSETEELFEMRNGSGDHLLILFKEDGVCINGFAHERKMKSLDEIFDGLPSVFHDFIFGEPVKSIGTTFCIWQTKLDKNWKIGNIIFPNDNYQDGSSELLKLLDGNPMTYKEWAEDYYEEEFEEKELGLNFVKQIYNNSVITKELVEGINFGLIDFEKLESDLIEIGYDYNL